MYCKISTDYNYSKRISVFIWISQHRVAVFSPYACVSAWLIRLINVKVEIYFITLHWKCG